VTLKLIQLNYWGSLTRTFYSKIERLGDGGSDFAAFVQHVGIPAAAMFFGGGNKQDIFILLTSSFSLKGDACMHTCTYANVGYAIFILKEATMNILLRKHNDIKKLKIEKVQL
jgi:hypothetical protein